MLFHALVASAFRNLQQVLMSPHPRFNVLFGDNGQGKTNLLEAIYLLATLRSFRTTRIEELVSFGGEQAELKARVEHRQINRLLGLQLAVRPTKKQVFVDGKTARVSEYFGGVNVVLFAPEDLRLPKGPPVGRRRFLDRAVWNTCPAYLDEVRTYEKVLRSRNALLRSSLRLGKPSRFAPPPSLESEGQPEPTDENDLLAIYDQQLASSGAKLILRRRMYLAELAPQVAATFEQVSRSGLSVQLRYEPGVSSSRQAAALQAADVHALVDVLSEQLQRDRKRDLLRGFTHSGPHADDLAMDLDGRAADIHASQGQIRALVLALKIAEIQHLYRILGDPPVLLLDDVSSELDAQRNGFLFDFLRAMPCQVFITTTSPAYVQLASDRQDFHIHGGQLLEASSLGSRENNLGASG